MTLVAQGLNYYVRFAKVFLVRSARQIYEPGIKKGHVRGFFSLLINISLLYPIQGKYLLFFRSFYFERGKFNLILYCHREHEPLNREG